MSEEIDALVARVRRQEMAITALTEETQELRRQRDDARAHVAAFRALLAVIYRFVELPLPVKEHWDLFRTATWNRLDQVRWMANELMGAHSRAHDAERWRLVLEGYLRAGLPYEASPDMQPKKPERSYQPVHRVAVPEEAKKARFPSGLQFTPVSSLTLTPAPDGAETMSATTTRHTARSWPVPDEPTLWSVTWLPGRNLTRNQAVTAMTIAEIVGSASWAENSSSDSPWWLFLDSWAAELGISAPNAVALVSLSPEEHAEGIKSS